MYWLFFVSLLLLALLFVLKSYEISSDRMLFASNARKNLDRSLEGMFAKVVYALKVVFYHVRESSFQVIGWITSGLSRLLRKIADRLE